MTDFINGMVTGCMLLSIGFVALQLYQSMTAIDWSKETGEEEKQLRLVKNDDTVNQVIKNHF